MDKYHNEKLLVNQIALDLITDAITHNDSVIPLLKTYRSDLRESDLRSAMRPFAEPIYLEALRDGTVQKRVAAVEKEMGQIETICWEVVDKLWPPRLVLQLSRELNEIEAKLNRAWIDDVVHS